MHAHALAQPPCCRPPCRRRTPRSLVVTLSAFLVIGATSALTYNVCSHMKTALVMAGGVVAWGDALPLAKLLGLLLALGGVVAYTSLQ